MNHLGCLRRRQQQRRRSCREKFTAHPMLAAGNSRNGFLQPQAITRTQLVCVGRLRRSILHPGIRAEVCLQSECLVHGLQRRAGSQAAWRQRQQLRRDIAFQRFAREHGLELHRTESLNASPVLAGALADLAQSPQRRESSGTHSHDRQASGVRVVRIKV